jgi:protein SCO1/2
LDNVENTNVSEDKTRIGPAPKFELINQDGLKITNESYKGKVYVLEFSLLPALLFVLK